MKLKSGVSDTLAKAIIRTLPMKLAADLRYFELWESRGFHITPVHFYQPIPVFRQLRRRDWNQRSEMKGVDLNFEDQLRFLLEHIPKYCQELHFSQNPTNTPYDFHLNNGYFESVDAEILHSIIRECKPRRIIEIGSGYSTFLAARACLINRDVDDVPTELCAIDPYPSSVVKAGFPGLSELIERPVEQVRLDYFQRLGKNDILFVDSSHVVRIAGDVIFEVLEILPRLRMGVIIHFHDVFWPMDYPREWVLTLKRFWTEQYLLQAFLSFNDAFEVMWASSPMYFSHAEDLSGAFPSWPDSFVRLPEPLQKWAPTFDGRNVWPCSLWIRKVK